MKTMQLWMMEVWLEMRREWRGSDSLTQLGYVLLLAGFALAVVACFLAW